MRCSTPSRGDPTGGSTARTASSPTRMSASRVRRPVEVGAELRGGQPQVVLDACYYRDTEEVLHAVSWGRGGWLDGTQGVPTHANVGKPGASDSERQRLNAAMWGYHQSRKVF